VIVLDASAVVELLLGTSLGKAVAERLLDPRIGLHAPHLIDVEIAQAVRRYVRAGTLHPGAALAVLEDLGSLDIERHSHEALLGRVWALRDNMSAYDAVYVALAEALETTLLTCDGRLARAPGMSRRVELVS